MQMSHIDKYNWFFVDFSPPQKFVNIQNIKSYLVFYSLYTSTTQWLILFFAPSFNIIKKKKQKYFKVKVPFMVVASFFFQIQFSKQNLFDKNRVEMIFKSFSKHFYTHFQSQDKKKIL